MASNILSGDQLNFTRMGIASVDEIKVVLADILRCEIKPQDLPKSITACSELTTGRHKLRPEQQRLCCPSPPGVPDYNKFDVSLLYALIRNLCPQLKPTQGWGKTPSITDLQVGDDIERLREFRNEMFAHLDSSSVEDVVFTSKWLDLEQIFKRMQTFLQQKGLSVNYEKNLKNIEKADFGMTDMGKYKILLEGTMYLLKKYPINDNPSVTIRGKAEVLCGEKTFFEAELDNCPLSSNLPITWEKFQGNVTEQLDISKEKYRGSSSRILVLSRVLMEDNGEYRAVISREHVKIQSNAILLTVRGELPRLQKLKVGPEKDDINIQYKYEISQDIPKVHHIAWTKNGKVLKIDNMKYIGGDLKDNLLKITSPSVEDRGRYTCTITNAVGSVSESLILDPPNISNDHLTRINSQSVILTCEIFPYDQSPPLTKLQWQKDGQVIDIPGSGGKYTGGTLDEPSLTITNVNQSDAGNYQCKASNAVGSTFGEAISLGFPVFQVLGPENTESGICVFTMNSSSCPAVFSVQWSKKNKDNDEYTPIDVNDKEYLGTSNSLPNPKLVIKQAPLHKHSFKVEAQNFIGTSTKKIPDDSSFPTASKVDNKANRVAAIFKNKGTSFRFDKLRLKLIEEIPDTKLDSLKESIKVITQKDLSVENVTTVEGFFTLILNEGIFSQQSVILMQYLLKSIGRPDLEQKCVEYARKTKASCFFKEPEHPENGHVYVQLHVNDDINEFVEKDELFETVAEIVGCDKNCIEEVGLRPENSFIIVISMKEEFGKKLVQKDQLGLKKLLKYNVDRIKVGNKVIDIAQDAIKNKKVAIISGTKKQIEYAEEFEDRLKKEFRMEKNEDAIINKKVAIIFGSKRQIEYAEEFEDRLKKELRMEKNAEQIRTDSGLTMSKRKGSELAGPSRKKPSSHAGPSSRVTDEEEEEEEMDLTQRQNYDVNTREADIGIVEKICLKNFMCHSRLDVSLGPHVNFIVGRNGSGKSAVVTALVVGLGGKASVTSRGSTIKSFIKSGKNTAETEIHLRNRGPDAYKSQIYGDKIIVERKFTGDGSSFYKIKSKEGKVISKKREELTAILDQFNIQVDNPVAILNQDTSRNFLNSKSPQDRYKFFLKATQLEQMMLDYTRANEQRERTKEIIEKKQQTLPILEKEVLEWEQKFKSLTALDELETKMKKRKEELAWAFVISRERDLQQMQKNLQQEESRIPKFKQKVEEAKVKVDSCIKKHNDLKELLKSTNDEVKQLRPQFDAAKETLKEAKADLRTRQNEFRKKESELRKLGREIEDINARIKELQISAKYDYEAERRKREEKIANLEEQMKALKAQQKTTEHDRENFRGAVNKLVGEERQMQADVNSMKLHEDRKKKKLNDLLGAKNDRLARFGPYMPTLLQHIEERYRRKEFHQKPRGPLGACFKLRDPKWALAVERCLSGLLHSFCCQDHHDEKVLESIFDRVCNDRQRPSIIVSAFKNAVYNVSAFRAQSDKFPAIFDVVESQDPVVINSLIDQRGIENILLIEDKTEARTVMDPDVQAQPVNCHEAFTVEGDQVHSVPCLRYYSNTNTHVKVLTSNTEQDIHRLQGEVTQLRQEIQKKEQSRASLRDNLRQNQKEEKKCETQLMKIEQKLSKVNNEIYELKSIEDPAQIDVTTLEEEVNNLDTQIGEMTGVRDELHAQYQDSLTKCNAEEQKFKEVESKMREKAGVGEPLKDEFGLAQVEIEQAKSHHKHYEQKLSEQEAKISEEKKKVEEEAKGLESDVKKAEQICAERINTRRTIQNLESEITQILKQIKAKEKSRGNVEEITRSFYEKREMYRKIQSEVRECRRFIQQLEKVMNQRQQQYSEFRKFIAMRAKYFFIVLLSNRNYTGKISFNHSKETLEMNVQPTVTEGEGAKDLRSLSGGERSFSTVCFILALWDAMESPFRCLDEFDVFMDMVIRRISMDMMMAVAKNQRHKQFIFLTPQNMSKLGIEIPSRRIFWMPDPDRGQGALPYKSVRNEEQDED